MPDSDRFLDFPGPGAHEWWYFDAIGDDGRDAIVLVWYAALPFDPEYGLGARRHLADPTNHPAPRALDHCAVGVGWYRDGKTVAYALNRYDAGAFRYEADPFAVAVGSSRVERAGGEYRLEVKTPAVDGSSRIEASLRFRPASASEPFERDLGGPGAPHVWIVAAADCRVEGRIAIEGKRKVATEFRGRGYHDHNAGAEEISAAFRRWRWGRVHAGAITEVYYEAIPHAAPPQSLRVTFRDGRPERVAEGVSMRGEGTLRNVFGVRDDRRLMIGPDEPTLVVRPRRCVDDGPFYRRWLSDFTIGDGAPGQGFGEVLDTRLLHARALNWMIPYRLKRPAW